MESWKRRQLSAGPAMASYDEYPREDKHQIEFLDFFVDGQPLRELLSVPDEMAKPEQETTALRDDWPHAAVEQLDRLMALIPGDFSDGRVSLLICPVCGDQACGALTMELTTAADTVTWRRFGWQDGITDEPQPWLFCGSDLYVRSNAIRAAPKQSQGALSVPGKRGSLGFPILSLQTSFPLPRPTPITNLRGAADSAS
ncbi:hypothetical protein [Arthrobacter sp. NPDC057009]|uniref:hypothetical protein n=1 Tax=Arthrobacter sp. NPDC057009 TaxID=3345996 RepID=UPI00362EF77E